MKKLSQKSIQNLSDKTKDLKVFFKPKNSL